MEVRSSVIRYTFLLLLFILAPVDSQSAISIDVGGSGELSYIPYYSVRNNLITKIELANQSPKAKAVSLIIREGRNNRTTLDFNIYLPPAGVWKGELRQNAQGKAVLFALGPSCSVPDLKYLTTGITLFTFDLTDGGPTDDERLLEGYIEVITMADIIGASAQDIADFNCQKLNDNWSIIAGVYGLWVDLPEADSEAPTDGLEVRFEVLAADGSVITDSGVVTFDKVLNQIVHTRPGKDPNKIYKLIDTQADIGGMIETFSEGVDAISALLMTQQISLPAPAPSLEAAQPLPSPAGEWIITLPTQQFYIDPQLSPMVPESPFSATYDPASGSCESIDISVNYSDGTAMQNFPGLGLCFASSVVQFGAVRSFDTALGLSPQPDATSSILGDGTVNFPGGTLESEGGTFFTGLPVISASTHLAFVASPDIRHNINSNRLRFFNVGNEQGITQEVIVSNAGDDALSFSCFSANNEDFSFTGCEGKVIAPDEQTTFTITCEPNDQLGTVSALLTITSNDPIDPTIEISIRCDLVSSAPQISVSPLSVDFGLLFDDQRISRNISVRNLGLQELIFDCSIDKDQYFSVSGCPGSVAVSPNPLNLLVYCEPPGTYGVEIGQLTITSNDPEKPEVQVELKCQRIFTGPEIFVHQTAIDFGDVFSVDQRTVLNFMRNLGQQDLIVDCSLGDNINFNISGCESPLTELQWTNLEITCNPGSQLGPLSTLLTITSNDSDEGIIEIPLTCNRLASEPEIFVNVDSIVFTKHFERDQDLRLIFVRNFGRNDLSIDCEIDKPEYFSIINCDGLLTWLEFVNLEVVCKSGTETGLLSGVLTINSNDPDLPKIEISIECEKLSSDPVLVVPDTDPGTVLSINPLGYPQTAVRFGNSGLRDPLELDCSFEPDSEQAISVVYPINLETQVLTIAPGGEAVVVFECLKAPIQSTVAKLSCSTNDLNQPQISIQVRCIPSAPSPVPLLTKHYVMLLILLMLGTGLGLILRQSRSHI